MVYGVFIYTIANPTISIIDDISRFSARWNSGCHNALVITFKCLNFARHSVSHTFLRFISNRLLLSPPSHSTPADSNVEWAYAFDVHTNAFFPLYLTLYLVQLFLVPIILQTKWICIFVSNTLYLAGCVIFRAFITLGKKLIWIRFAQYIYGIYLGLNGMLSSNHQVSFAPDLMSSCSTSLFSAFGAATCTVATTIHCLYHFSGWVQRGAICVTFIFRFMSVQYIYLNIYNGKIGDIPFQTGYYVYCSMCGAK